MLKHPIFTTFLFILACDSPDDEAMLEALDEEAELRTNVELDAEEYMEVGSGAAEDLSTPAHPASNATAGPCVWKDLDGVNREKICAPIFQMRYGTTVSHGLSVYHPPITSPHSSYTINFELTDAKTVKGCTRIRMVLTDTAYPVNAIVPNTEVCDGKSRVFQFEFSTDTLDPTSRILPGLLKLKQCARGKCFTFAEQRIHRPDEID